MSYQRSPRTSETIRGDTYRRSIGTCREGRSAASHLPISHSSTVPNRTCGRRSGTFPDPGHIPAAAPVALWSQYSSFFWKMNPGTIYMVSPARSKVTMSPNSIGRRHTYGAGYDSENCTGRGERRAADVSASTQTWRCRKRPGDRDHVFFPLCVGRRKRHQLLGPRLLWKPRGHAAAAGLVAGEYLLPYLRICRRRRRAFA